jgi:hypothetical protein
MVNSSFAQDNTKTTSDTTVKYVVTKTNGTEYIGIILSDDGREVLINTENLGKIYIPKSDILSIVTVTDSKNIIRGEFRSSGPFTTRYAFTTNSHPIKKGENYAMLNLYGPEIHFAVMDNFSIGLMSTWIASPMVLALKYSIKTPNPKINIAIGTLMGSSGYLYNFRGFGGLHWLSLTYGDRMNNISISGGYAYIRSGNEKNYLVEGIYHNEAPIYQAKLPITPAIMFSLAGIAKVGSKASFVFDSMGFIFDNTTFNQVYNEITPGYYDDITSLWVSPTYTYTVTKNIQRSIGLLLMPGFRFQKNENHAFQVSLSGVSIFGSESLSFPFPMCSWYFKF